MHLMRMRLRLRLLSLLAWTAAACVSAPAADLGHGAVRAIDLPMPRDPRPGMFATWRLEYSDPSPDDLVEETIACVGRDDRFVMTEWRRTYRDGRRGVVAARHRLDGTLVGVWTGADGGVGERRRIQYARPSAAAIDAETDELARSLGLAPERTRVTRARGDEDVRTAAGEFHCLRHRTEISLSGYSTAIIHWWSRTPLPLDLTVAQERVGPFARRRRELVAFGKKGARATLRIPKDEPRSRRSR